MKLLIIFATLSLASCSVLETGKNLISGSYEVGKARGRMEVLKELEENKKKLDEFKAIITQEILLSIQNDDYEKLQKELPAVLAVITPLIIKRRRLKNELKVAK